MAPRRRKHVFVPLPDSANIWPSMMSSKMSSEGFAPQDGNNVEEESLSECDDRSCWSDATPPESTASQPPVDHDDELPNMEKEENDEGVFEDEFDSDTVNGAKLTTSNVPWPGSTFIIRRALSEDTIMQVVLTGLDGWGSNYWACEQNKGWLGFRNPVSGKLLGHDGKGRLCCSADRHRDYEKFCVRQNPEGGYTLLMTHSSDLWRVGTALDGGLAKIEDSSPNEIIWEFVKVDQD